MFTGKEEKEIIFRGDEFFDLDDVIVDMLTAVFVSEENILSVTEDTEASIGMRLSESGFTCSIFSKAYNRQKNLEKHNANSMKEKRLVTHFFFNLLT